MTPEAARLALQFLARVQLTGQEVPAYNFVASALERIAESPDKEPEVIEAEES